MNIKIYQDIHQQKDSLGSKVRFMMMVIPEDKSLERDIYESTIEITADMALLSDMTTRLIMAENAIKVFKKLYVDNFLTPPLPKSD